MSARAWCRRLPAVSIDGIDRSGPPREGRPPRPRLFALLRGAVEGLAEALERIAVGGLRAARRGALDDQVSVLAHGLHHARLFGRILDPGAVILRVHRELGGTDLHGGVGARFEAVADDDG